jgi:hypothetical protein
MPTGIRSLSAGAKLYLLSCRFRPSDRRSISDPIAQRWLGATSRWLSRCGFAFVDQAAEDVTAVELPGCADCGRHVGHSGGLCALMVQTTQAIASHDPSSGSATAEIARPQWRRLSQSARSACNGRRTPSALTAAAFQDQHRLQRLPSNRPQPIAPRHSPAALTPAYCAPDRLDASDGGERGGDLRFSTADEKI